MVLIMKAISYTSDEIDSELISYTSYLISISTCFFGPWLKYEEHLAALQSKKMFTVNSAKNIVISMVCLSCSNCFLSVLDFTHELSWIFKMYLEALSFRLSNYFVCYFSQAMCDFSSVSKSIVRPMSIEFPRSLIDVVTSWNLPMHQWLKNYIFTPSKQIYGTPRALFFTYFGSVMIHGFDGNISLVLFSLGFYTYVEYGLRKNLSSFFNCCAEARKCREKCGHQYKDSQLIPFFLNKFFFVMNVYHLAYLGQIFFYNNDSMEKDQNWIQIALSMWSQTFYSSHLISIFSLIISILIRRIL